MEAAIIATDIIVRNSLLRRSEPMGLTKRVCQSIPHMALIKVPIGHEPDV